MRTETTDGAAGTIELGAALGHLLAPGDLVLLRGEIGAGKTTFVKGIAAGLGVVDDVVSPTFMLHCVYEGALTLNHFDFYRLDEPSDTLIFGLDETLDEGGVAVVEWADRLPETLRPPYLDVEITADGSDEERTLRLTPVGGDWERRIDRLAW